MGSAISSPQSVSNHPIRSTVDAAFELRPACPGDEDFQFAVFAAWRGQQLACTGCSDTQIELLLRLQFRSQQREYAARFPDSRPSIILAGGHQVGIVHLA